MMLGSSGAEPEARARAQVGMAVQEGLAAQVRTAAQDRTAAQVRTAAQDRTAVQDRTAAQVRTAVQDGCRRRLGRRGRIGRRWLGVQHRQRGQGGGLLVTRGHDCGAGARAHQHGVVQRLAVVGVALVGLGLKLVGAHHTHLPGSERSLSARPRAQADRRQTEAWQRTEAPDELTMMRWRSQIWGHSLIGERFKPREGLQHFPRCKCGRVKTRAFRKISSFYMWPHFRSIFERC